MQKTFALNDFIINDRQSFVPPVTTCTILSLLRGGIGIPGLSPRTAMRQGRRPLLSGVDWPVHRYSLTTHFLADIVTRKIQREQLLAELSAELEKVSRLFVADHIPPEGLLAAFGPWDARVDAADAWTCNSLLWSRDAAGELAPRLVADLTGAVHFEDGRESRQRAIVIEEAIANSCLNPSVEIDTTDWTATGSAAISRVTTEYKFGVVSLEVDTDGAAASEGVYYSRAAFGGVTDYTASVWVKAPSGATMRLRFHDGPTTSDTDFTGTGDWQRVEVTHTTDVAPTTTRIYIYTVTSAQDITFYVDALQIEQSDYSTTYADGSLGPGYAWSGTVHYSATTRSRTEFNLDNYASVISERCQLTFRLVWKPQYDADGDWPSSVSALMGTRGADNNNRVIIGYDETTNAYTIYINGAYEIISSAQTFSANEWQEVVLTLDFDADSFILYVNGSQDGSDSTAKTAPVLTEWNLGSSYSGASMGNVYIAEFDVWDRVLNADEVSQMYSNGSAHGRARYVEVICEGSDPLVIGGTPTNRGDVSTLTNNDDVCWRSRDGDWAFSAFYDDTWTMYVDVDSDEGVRPEIRLTPGTQRTVTNRGFRFRAPVLVEWKLDAPAVLYPVRITMNTSTPIGSSKMQSDGDDLRVYVNGAEIDRWLADVNSATTKIWINLDFDALQTFTLDTAIAAAGTIDEIQFSESDDLSSIPSSGLLLIDSEVLAYTDKDDLDKRVTGITRAVRGTSMGAHTVGDTITWIQFDVIVVYGDSSLSAPNTDDDYKPAFNLSTSTNDSWDYDDFGDNNKKRAAGWVQEIMSDLRPFEDDESVFAFTTAAAWTQADPWSAIGINATHYHGDGSGPPVLGASLARWKVYNPCGITSVSFAGNTISESTTTGESGLEKIQSSENGVDWTNEGTLGAGPFALDAGGADKWVALYNQLVTTIPYGDDSNAYARGEVTDATLTLYSTETPDTTIRTEEATYHFKGTLEHSESGYVLKLDYPLATIDSPVIVDTELQTIIDSADGFSYQSSLSVREGIRKDWLRLVKGDNTLEWDDVGTEEVSVCVGWTRRDFE